MSDSDKTIEMLKQVIKEVKQEMQTKKVLTEAKEPEQIFKKHEKDMRSYITENVLKVLKDAEK